MKFPTKAELSRRVKELEAQLASTHYIAATTLHKASNLKGSAVILELNALGGAPLIKPVAIRGGLSPDTIEAIHRDLVRSYEEATELKPICRKKND